MRAVVIGSGVIGAACSWALSRRGCDVVVLSRDAPGAAQSSGATRIFRLNHDDPLLVEDARLALDLWRVWEREFRTTLLDASGAVVTGGEASRFEDTAGQSFAEWEEGRVHPYSRLRGRFRLEPTGATGHIARAVDHLLRHADVRQGDVVEVDPGVVRLSDGRELAADRIVVCAGVNSRPLVGRPQVPLGSYRRFSYPVRDLPQVTPPAWLQRDPAVSPPFYAVQDGPGRFAIGLSESGDPTATDDEDLAGAEPFVTEIVRSLLPALEPRPVDRLRCVFPTAETGVASRFTHDGFDLFERDGVLAISGPNLFKFAPLLGRRAADILCGPDPALVQ